MGRYTRRRFTADWAMVLAASLLAPAAGCQAPWMKKKKDEPEPVRTDDLEPELEFVGDLTRAWGLGYMKVEGIALVTSLRGTGSDPPPSDRRTSLTEEMKVNGVTHPDEILALSSTAMVYIKAYLPPGARKEDPCDIIVESPPRTETTSLRDGWLMRSRLRPVEVLGNRLRQGKVLGFAEGPVLYDAAFHGDDDKMNLIRGQVLGGGTCKIERPVGLVVTAQNHSLMTTSHVAAAVNRRFFAYDHGKKVGVAEPKDDDYIELKINPRYEHNLSRYLRVVQSVAIHESPQQRIDRLGRLEALLLDPISSPRAALRLEAIGQEAVPVLRKGLSAKEPDVRFYSAEALAYVEENQSEAGPAPEIVPALLQAARESRPFRWHALTALSVVQHGAAAEALNELLHAHGVETRCGALRALQTRNSKDPLVCGEWLKDPKSKWPVVKLVVVSSAAEPVVHFMRYREPEVAIFARELRLRPPFSLFAGKEIVVKSQDEGRVKVSRFAPGEDERRLECSTRLDDVLRAIVGIGGGYADVYQVVREAQKSGALAARVEVNALPTADRSYDRSESTSDEPEGDSPAPDSLPGLFSDRTSDDPQMEEVLPAEETPPGLWQRMKEWVMPK